MFFFAKIVFIQGNLELIMNIKLHRFWALFWGIGLTSGWIYYILTDQLPELHETPYQAWIELVAELILSVGMIIVGIKMSSMDRPTWINWYRFFLGMYLFSAIQSVAFFVQDGWLSASIQWILFSIWAVWAIFDVNKEDCVK